MDGEVRQRRGTQTRTPETFTHGLLIRTSFNAAGLESLKRALPRYHNAAAA